MKCVDGAVYGHSRTFSATVRQGRGKGLEFGMRNGETITGQRMIVGAQTHPILLIAAAAVNPQIHSTGLCPPSE